MRAILKSTDPTLISFVLSLLDDAGLDAHCLDQNASIVEGSIGALPRRIVVPDHRLDEARRLLSDAGLGGELLDED